MTIGRVIGSKKTKIDVAVFNGGERAQDARAVFAPVSQVAFIAPSQVMALSASGMKTRRGASMFEDTWLHVRTHDTTVLRVL